MIDPITGYMIGSAAASIGSGIYGLLKKDPYKDAQVQAGASAQRLEQSLTSAALARLSGRLDPATRAQIQRAVESNRAQTASQQAELSRDFTRRGLSGSGLRDAARLRVARQGKRQGAATAAGIDLASMESAKMQGERLALEQRRQESQLHALSLQRKAAFIGLIRSGVQLGGTAAGYHQGVQGGAVPAPATAPAAAPTSYTPSSQNDFLGFQNLHGFGPVQGFIPRTDPWKPSPY